MNVNIKSKPNQELKYIDPNFDKTDVPEDDWEFIYCEDFFNTGQADDYGANHMFDYDYETGIVTFNFDGSEDDLKEIRKIIENKIKPSTSTITSKTGNIPLVKQAERALKITYLEAKLFKSNLIGTEHLLLSILKINFLLVLCHHFHYCRFFIVIDMINDRISN
mgnify:CR=1 FL=1